MPDALYIPGAPKREPLGRGGEAARWRSAGRGLPTRLSHSGVRTSHQPTAAVPWHSLSSPESRRQRDRTRDRCSAATEYRGTRRDSRPLRLWQWHRRTESGQNPAPVRVRPRWSYRIPTRIAHGIGHDHARVFMEAFGEQGGYPKLAESAPNATHQYTDSRGTRPDVPSTSGLPADATGRRARSASRGDRGGESTSPTSTPRS